VSVLEVPSPALTPTNLLYNLIAIPGALLQYRRRRQLGQRLARLLVLGTLPGVVAGAVIRVELLAGPNAFYLVIGAVLIPLGAWLGLRRSPLDARPARVSRRGIIVMSLAVG
jgi:uncharacterized protein